MTIRDYIKRRIRIGAAVAMGGWMVCMAAAQSMQSVSAEIVVGMGVLLFGGSALSLMRLRCPKCQNRIGGIIGLPAAFSIWNPPNNCPYCGVRLDEQMPP
jgi:hypothetical protein